MTRLAAAELLKLRTTWGVWVYVAALLALVALTVSTSIATRPDEIPFDDEEFRSVVEGAGAASIFALLLGILGFTTEFRHGTISQTLLVEPVRERVLAAKLAAFAVVGLALGALALALALAIAVPWLRARGVDVSPADPALRPLLGGVLAGCALWAVLGVALGAAVRSQVAAVVGVFVWIFVAEPLLGVPFSDEARYLPGAASRALAGLGFDDDLSQGAGALVTLAWAAGATALAALLLRRRDAA